MLVKHRIENFISSLVIFRSEIIASHWRGNVVPRIQTHRDSQTQHRSRNTLHTIDNKTHRSHRLLFIFSILVVAFHLLPLASTDTEELDPHRINLVASTDPNHTDCTNGADQHRNKSDREVNLHSDRRRGYQVCTERHRKKLRSKR